MIVAYFLGHPVCLLQPFVFVGRNSSCNNTSGMYIIIIITAQPMIKNTISVVFHCCNCKMLNDFSQFVAITTAHDYIH